MEPPHITSLRNDLKWMRDLWKGEYPQENLEVLTDMAAEQHSGSVRECSHVECFMLMAVKYIVSGLDPFYLQKLVDTCVSLTGCCDIELWTTLGRCGFSASSFPSGTYLLTGNGEVGDLLSAPLFPGGSYVLEARHIFSAPAEHDVPGKEAPFPSVTSKTYADSAASCHALDDGQGRVVFPVHYFSDERTVKKFFTAYLDSILRQQWISVLVEMEPISIYNSANAQIKFTPSLISLIGEHTIIHFTNELRDHLKHHQSAFVKKSSELRMASAAEATVADMEDLPKCAKKVVAKIMTRGSTHPVDEERLLVFGLLAHRIPQTLLMKVAKTLDTDGGKTAQNYALARKTRYTQSCSSVIESKLCAFSSDAERYLNCWRHIPVGRKWAPATLFESPPKLTVKFEEPTESPHPPGIVVTAYKPLLFDDQDI